MRKACLLLLPLFAAGCADVPQRHGPPPGPPPGAPPMRAHGGPAGGGRLFVSPMGEPFRGPGGEARWFEAADTDHDGAISRAEMLADAQRFFTVLDRRGDGEIDPDDIAWYENELLPEVRVAGDGGGRGAGPGGGRGGRGPGGGGPGGGGPGGGPGGGGPAGDRSGGAQGRTGAGRFAYLDFPEPVVAADANINRGISPAEFADSARARFALLDHDHDGRLTRGELPPVSPRPQRP